MSRLSLLFYNIYSLFICLRYFPLKVAIRVPMLIHPTVRIKHLHKGGIVLRNPSARLVIGFDAMPGQSNCQSLLSIQKGAGLVLHGFTTMARGTRLIIDSGEVVVGKNFFCNGDCFIRCTNRIVFGDDCLLGWEVSLNTSDGHTVFHNGIRKSQQEEIHIGDHVWIASKAILAKGSSIANGCIVGQASLVLKPFDESDCLIAGTPARILQNNCTWEA